MSISYEPGWSPGCLILSGGAYFAEMTRDQFFDFCARNPDVPFERTAAGDLLVTTPAGADSSRRNSELTAQLAIWNKRDGAGVVFDCSAGFWLPNKALRSPDAAWVRRDRWEALSQVDREKFAPLAPDFVAELRSKSDRLSQLRGKMQEYVGSGVRLAWLIDPWERCVEVYRPDRDVVVWSAPAVVAGDPELPGFTLDCAPLWS